ncbi:MAG: hypothetical protein M3O02_08635, partial [Acidobacteriota bacterium]|nr:hypothetical protein [Acidobacteriota bacterium]
AATEPTATAPRRRLAAAAPLLAALLALLATAETLRTAVQQHRELTPSHLPGGAYADPMQDAADALAQLGVRPGDSVACIGTSACLSHFYWARLAGVRILTEISAPRAYPYPFLRDLPNRDQAIEIVRAQGARVLVADFVSSSVSSSDPFFGQWRRLGDTTLYALPLNLNH